MDITAPPDLPHQVALRHPPQVLRAAHLRQRPVLPQDLMSLEHQMTTGEWVCLEVLGVVAISLFASLFGVISSTELVRRLLALSSRLRLLHRVPGNRAPQPPPQLHRPPRRGCLRRTFLAMSKPSPLLLLRPWLQLSHQALLLLHLPCLPQLLKLLRLLRPPHPVLRLRRQQLLLHRAEQGALATFLAATRFQTKHLHRRHELVLMCWELRLHLVRKKPQRQVALGWQGLPHLPA